MPGLFVGGQRSRTGSPSQPLGACASNRLLASTMSGRCAAPWRASASMWSARSNPPVSPGCVATLHTNTTSAPDAAIASRIPGTTSAGRRLVNRLPGPMTMSSASAIALERVLGRVDVLGRDPDAVDAVGPGDPALPGDLGAVVEPRAERDHGARRRHDPAAHREHAVHLAHRLLEVALLELAPAPRAAGCRRRGRRGPPAASPGLARPGPAGRRRTGRGVDGRRGAGEAVLEQPAHQRLGVGQRHDAVADVADRRDPELGPEHAGRAAVVGDGDHGREVGRVLLEPAQQRREAGPAADRDDARAAGEEPLLVDDLDHRLLAVPGANGSTRARTSR